MKLSSELLVTASADQVWAVLGDLEQLLPLISGVQFVGREGDRLLCRADVRVGEFSHELAGRIRLREADPTRHRVVIEVRSIQAEDGLAEGDGQALTITAHLHPVHGHGRVTVDTDATLTGELAAVDAVTLQHGWDRLLHRVFERIDRQFVGQQPEPTDNVLLKYAATGAAVAFQTVMGLLTGRPVNPLRLFRRPPGEWITPPRDPH